MPDQTPASGVIQWMLSTGGKRAHLTGDIRGEYIVYCVTNGPNILAVGEGRADRLKGLLPGSACRKHFKSFIVAAGQALLGTSNEFYYCVAGSKAEAGRLEAELHARFGQAHVLSLGPGRSMSEVGQWLWSELKKTSPDVNERLDAVMSLVCQDGDILVTLLKTPEFGPAVHRILRGYYKSVSTGAWAA
jgi:hypothetical protein